MPETLPANLVAPGMPAPDFTLPRDGGGEISLSDLRGQKVVLYFYPKDDTSGCTTEALDFTAAAADFQAAGAVILGVSKDTVKKHDKFVAKHDLGIALLSDADSDMCERYGVWGDKQMYGKTYQGIMRTTYLIDAGGQVARVWPSVKVKGHVQDVLAAVREF